MQAREEHVRLANTLRSDARRTLQHVGDENPAWAQANAALAQAQVLLATSHEAAASRLDAEQFRKDLNTVHPSGWQLPAEVLPVGRDLLGKIKDVRERFTTLWKNPERGSEFNLVRAEVVAFEAMAQFVSRLLNEIESRNLVEADEV